MQGGCKIPPELTRFPPSDRLHPPSARCLHPHEQSDSHGGSLGAFGSGEGGRMGRRRLRGSRPSLYALVPQPSPYLKGKGHGATDMPRVREGSQLSGDHLPSLRSAPQSQRDRHHHHGERQVVPRVRYLAHHHSGGHRNRRWHPGQFLTARSPQGAALPPVVTFW